MFSVRMLYLVMKSEQGNSFYHCIIKPYAGELLLIIAGLVAYSGTLDQPFHYDDIGNIAENPLIRDIRNIPRFFFDIKGPAIAVRPLTSATFALNYSISGLDTTSYHVLNIALHIINGLLLYFLVLKCTRRLAMDRQRGSMTALVAALLFMVHPVQTESVTYLVTRSMLLAALFYFLGFLVFLLAVESRKGRWAFAFAMGFISFLGMGSREDFVTFPLMLFTFDYVFVSDGSFKKVIRNFNLHVPAWLGMLYLGYLVISHDYISAGFGEVGIGPYEYFITQSRVHWTYLRMLVLPIGQNIDHDYSVSVSLLEPRTLIAFLGYWVIWASSALLVVRRPAVSMLILWFMITLTPASSIVPLADVIFEHRLYISSAGFFVLFALLLVRIQNMAVLAGLTVLLAVTLTASTYSRNLVWETEVSLWKDSVRKSPLKPRPRFSLGAAYLNMGHNEIAIREFNHALELRPIYPIADFNLGYAYLHMDQVDMAIKHFRSALRAEPEYYKARDKLTIALRKKGLYDESIREANIIIKYYPGDIGALSNLALAYLMKGEAALALEYLNEAIQLDPARPASYEILAGVYNWLGKYGLEKDALMKARALREGGESYSPTQD
ncbi:tetratricopeptide repeat protein [Nitrospirota bacterium]